MEAAGVLPWAVRILDAGCGQAGSDNGHGDNSIAGSFRRAGRPAWCRGTTPRPAHWAQWIPRAMATRIVCARVAVEGEAGKRDCAGGGRKRLASPAHLLTATSSGLSARAAGTSNTTPAVPRARLASGGDAGWPSAAGVGGPRARGVARLAGAAAMTWPSHTVESPRCTCSLASGPGRGVGEGKASRGRRGRPTTRPHPARPPFSLSVAPAPVFKAESRTSGISRRARRGSWTLVSERAWLAACFSSPCPRSFPLR